MSDLIDRQAALDIVMEELDSGTEYDIPARIKALPSAQQWIPCEERLPEPGVNVLVDVLDIPAGDRFPLVDKIGDDGDWCNCYGEWFAVAWMPIPEPYREDTP